MMIVVRVAKVKSYEMDHIVRTLPLMFYIELEMRNDISKIQYRGYDATNVKGLMRIIANYSCFGL